MPAARQTSRSPAIAFAVMATMRGPVGPGQRCADPAGGLEAVQLRHLQVHEHQVVRARLQGGDRPPAHSRPRPRHSPSARGAERPASGSRRCPRPPGFAAGAVHPGRSLAATGASAVAGVADVGKDIVEGIEQRRRLDRLREPCGDVPDVRARVRSTDEIRMIGKRRVPETSSSDDARADPVDLSGMPWSTSATSKRAPARTQSIASVAGARRPNPHAPLCAAGR